MYARIYRWIDERWPLSDFVRLGRGEAIPGGASFAYTLGSATLFVFLLQVATGVWQLFYYVPTVDHAYDSLNYLRTEVPFGWLIHGLHYWGANAMVVLVALHMARVFFWGAYKAPRELIWLSGVCLLVLTAGLSFTGAPLPWDERGYWAVEVGTSIMGSVPIVGNFAKQLLRGGEVLGQLTLSRFFVLHAAILPGILLALIGVHLIAFRRFGSVGPWDDARPNHSGLFWPDQVSKDVLVVSLLSLLLVGLSVYAPPPIAGPADPLDTSYIPKPEWNFLFLYETLKFLPARLEPFGTVGIPVVIILLLASLPFLDRGRERRPARRLPVIASGVVLVGVVATLTIAGLTSGTGKTQTASGSPPLGSVAHLSPSARRGTHLFESLGCLGCHRVNGTGGTLGPDLSHEALRNRSRQWLLTQIRNPKANNVRSIMPPYASLTDQQLHEVADYLLSLATKGTALPATPIGGEKATATPTKAAPPVVVGMTPGSPVSNTPGPPGQAAAMIGSARHGLELFDRHCASCHGPQGAGKVSNPGSEDGTVPPLNPIDQVLFNTEPQIFAENIDRVIQHGSVPTGPSPQLRMPGFGDDKSLTQQEISNIEAYILRLNGVDRAQFAHPGVPPRRFFYSVLSIFLLAGLGLGGFWVRIRMRLRRNTP